jgi:hypothetical protein
MNFASGIPSSFSSGADYGTCLKDTLRYLVEEGRAGSPKMMSVGLHCRLARPGRVAALQEFVDYAKSYGSKDVWICTREEIADYWPEHHYPKGMTTCVVVCLFHVAVHCLNFSNSFCSWFMLHS